jgi:hypothetical protein
MTTREFYVQRQQRAVALRSGDRGYHLLTFATCISVIEERRGEWKETPPLPLEEMVATYERSVKNLTELVARLDETARTQTAQFFYGGKMVSEIPVGDFL